MKQKAKPDFKGYGISLGKVGDNCNNTLTAAHSGKLHFVGDCNTIAATKAILPTNASIMEFDSPPKANDETIEQIRSKTSKADAIVAVGSGTLNDLCKYASFLDGKDYSVVATAPSMNGYVSANASITVDGYKSTLPAHAPTNVICDLDILSAAPTQLIRAGIGDSLCRSTVQADWLLSHLLLGTPYNPTYFDWLAEDEARLLENPHDSEALISSLLLSGIAMREEGSSAPASQGEHMIAHTMEMLNPDLAHSYHGEQIAITSLTMARQQETVLAQDRVTVANLEAFANLPLSMHKQAQQQTAEKLADDAAIETLNEKLAQEWPSIRERISKIILPSERLEQALKQAGCPTQPQEIGWNNSEYKKAVSLARFTRNRFTFLDLSL